MPSPISIKHQKKICQLQNSLYLCKSVADIAEITSLSEDEIEKL